MLLMDVFIDGPYTIHANAQGHSGFFLIIERGIMINTSKKLSLVTTSSTETEVVSSGERFPKYIWFRYFRLAQDPDNKENILFQDKKSAILL